ncbi:hypothetical protein BD408DRAFT_441670 [Parasitella parasitica]|nr:hypothetical protein BD408DRAFT_441670 [Parasitella parasitica]
MGFLNFRKKSKPACKAGNVPFTPPSVAMNNLEQNAADTSYHSPISDSFMMVGSSISDIAKSSLSEDIFNELIPLTTRDDSSRSKDTIRHSLRLKSTSNSGSPKTSKFSFRINTTMDSNISGSNAGDSIKSPLEESTISNCTKSSKESDSSDSSLTSLSSTEEIVPLHPLSRSDPQSYQMVSSKKLSEDVPLIDLVNRHPHEQQPVHVNATTKTVPGLAMARMKERHRQEYRRSMQWSPAPSPNILVVDPPSKKANVFNSQRMHPAQHTSLPSSPPPVSIRVQIPLINQKKRVIPTKSASNSTFTSDPFDRRPLITNILSNNHSVNYQQTRPPSTAILVADNRNFYIDNNVQLHTRQTHPQIEMMNANHLQYPRQRLAGIKEYQQQQHQYQQFVSINEASKSSKLKRDTRRIANTKKYGSVPDLTDLLNDEDTQKHQEKMPSHCSHHQPHHTLIKRQYHNNNNTCCPQKQHYTSTNFNNCSHHGYHHRKPICHNQSKCC